MKGIRNKIMVSFSLLVGCILLGIIVIISWQSSKSVTLQANILNSELIKQAYDVVDGHNAIAMTLLASIKQEIHSHIDGVATSPQIITNIEKNQQAALVGELKKEAKGGFIDYGSLYDLKGNLLATYPPNVDSSKLREFNETFSLWQKGKKMLVSKEKTAIQPEIVKHPEGFLDLYGLQKVVSGADALSISSIARVMDDFGDPIGFYIAGKMLNGYSAPFLALYEASGASSVLYLDNRAIAFAGFTAKYENAGSMNITLEDKDLIYKSDKNFRRNLALAGGNYLTTCTVLKDGEQKAVGALCTGQPESTIKNTRTKLESIGNQAKHSLLVWIITAGILSLLIFILVMVAITRSIIAPLQQIVTVLGSSSEELTAGSSQIASASQGLSDGASSQSASVEETAASLNEMTSMIQQNSENTDQAKGRMDEALRIVMKTKESMDEVHLSMVAISRSSEDTSKIIKTIDEIAFQTNLLALNAAVEAARAGEAGAGFAVVAEEVRNLAMRSTEAAKTTTSLLEESISKVKSGTLLVGATNEDFKSVAENVTTAAQLIAEVAVGSIEQTHAIKQIADAVNGINEITMANSAHAEESAAISQNFGQQADKLTEIVDSLSLMINSEKKASLRNTTSLVSQ